MLKHFALRGRLKSLRVPKLRLYQQLIIYFLFIVFLPSLGVSWFIYQTNQKALKKELVGFIAHSSETIYSNLQTQMGWQREQAYLMRTLLLESPQNKTQPNFNQAARRIFQLSDEFQSIGIYDAKGKALQRVYRDYSKVSPEQRLPQTLNILPALEPATTHKQKQSSDAQFSVVYVDSGTPPKTTYYLRIQMPLHAGNGRYVIMQKRFDYLQKLIASQNKQLYNRFFIIDDKGYIIAGPSQAVTTRQQISVRDLRFFRKIKAGVAKEFSSALPTLPSGSLGTKLADKDKELPLEKVFVRMPELGWGILIDSPFEVRQKYVKRAQTQTLLMLLASLLLILAMSSFYTYRLYRNFRQLIKGINAMGSGNYKRRIRLLTNWFTPYELVYLAGEFNRMGRKILRTWNEEQELTDELQEANRQLAKLDEMKSNLIDTVSHELRTPLTSIKGYTNRLIRHNDMFDAETRISNLKTIKRQAERLNRLVDDLLVVPELEQENLRMTLSPVDLNELIQYSVHFIQAKEHRQIEVTLPPNHNTSPLQVFADADRLEQVLLNLLDNAVKYSPENSPITIHIQKHLEHTPPQIEITVSNPSWPITPQELSQLFEKFKRVDETTTRTTRGSGLGLFITKGLVESMNGQIQLGFKPSSTQTQTTCSTLGTFFAQLSLPIQQTTTLNSLR